MAVGSGAISSGIAASVYIEVPVANAEHNEFLATTSYLIPIAKLSCVLMTVMAEPDPIGRNPVIIDIKYALDTSILGVNKRLFDILAKADISVIALKKVNSDSANTLDLKKSSLIKPVADPANTSESRLLAIGKSSTDYSTTIERAYVFNSKKLNDSSTSSELAKKQCSKVSIDTTTTSESSVRLFNKLLSDAAQTSELVSFIRNTKEPLDDASSTLELLSLGVSKSFSELFSKSDTAISNYAKKSVDAASTNEFHTTSTTKPFTDASITAEQKTFLISKTFTELVHPADLYTHLALLDDDPSLAYGKISAESVLKSDFSVIISGKQLTDSVSKIDNGFLVITGYCDISYFASDYVGSSQSF